MGAFGGKARGGADRTNREPGQRFQQISTIHVKPRLDESFAVSDSGLRIDGQNP
jgi:hypothetical protein